MIKLALLAALAANTERPLPSHTYIAPLPSSAEASDQDLATFDMAKAVWRGTGDDIEFDYSLPAELSGEPREVVRLRKTGMTTGGFVEFDGAAWTAICHRTDLQMVCTVKSKSLPPYVTSGDPERYLRDTYAGDARLETRINVAKHFREDPVGVIIVQLPRVEP